MPKPHVIIETGSYQTRAGLAGDTAPRVIQPTLVGRGVGEKSNETYIGAAARTSREGVVLSEPVREGQIRNWEDVTAIWRDVLVDKLGLNPQEHNVLLIAPPSLDPQDKEKITQIMFEKFKVPGLFVANSGVLSMYATGRLSGVVLEVGDGVIHAAPSHEGFLLPKAVTRWAFGGSGQNEFLCKQLSEKGYNLASVPEAVRQIKESMCYVAKNYDLETAKASDPDFQKIFKLPDETAVTLGSEMFKTSEVLFTPSVAGLPSGGVVALLEEAIGKCSAEQQKLMYGNIIVAGGPTLASGFVERLKKEVKSRAASATVVAGEHREHAAWLGGSTLAALDDFQSMWVKAADYKEKGAAVVHDKCK
ncbi:actin-like [Haliotis rubra]|uniref:actin-like n=1 Tax=Haliotis rubra TaxID=36100 RepID=UPI001EE60EA2|nr:actin-like [Haliotis rubra]XP_046546958.1 actin-like [Haliotis rubra]